MKQHITDPEACIQCSACELACPNKAIESILGRFCVDVDRCQNCGKCIVECPTGAADTSVEVAVPYSVAEQSEWICVPKVLNEKQDSSSTQSDRSCEG
jgi:ferredoxin